MGLAAALTLGGSGCAGAPQEVREGTAFAPDYATSIGSPPIRPGQELGWLYLYVNDTSKTALVINSLKISGPGIGTVARAVDIQVAPLRSGYHHYYVQDGTPGGTYMTDPPVFHGKACQKQALFPVPGHRLTPGSQVRFYIVIRALRPGKYSVRHQVLFYTQHGIRYQQAFPIRFWGSVADNAPKRQIEAQQAACVEQAGARPLSGWHLPKNQGKSP